MAYATLAQLRTYLALATSETDDDTFLTDCITRAQALIESEPPVGTGRVFEAASDTTKYFDGERDTYGRDLYWFGLDLCALTTFTINATSIGSTYYTLLSENGAAPYYGLRLKASTGITWEWDEDPENSIVIVGKWAYATSAPTAILQATLRLAAYLYRQRSFSTDEDRLVITEGTAIYPTRMPRDVVDILRSYQKRAGRG